MTEREIQKIIEKVCKLSRSQSAVASTKSILCTVDLGIVVLQVSMNLN